jgi:hypothetical protein
MIIDQILRPFVRKAFSVRITWILNIGNGPYGGRRPLLLSTEGRALCGQGSENLTIDGSENASN